MNNFSYENYRLIINQIQEHLAILDFGDVNENTKQYCVVRHDVEFSIPRAMKLAEIEKSLGICSTYCIQLRNNNYNIISEKNINLVNKIYDMGHNIALHVHLDCFLRNPHDGIKRYILNDSKILSGFLDLPINRFSIHRPQKKLISIPLKIEGMINLNGDSFFEYSDFPKEEKLKVLYLADSNHQWKYGNPLEIDISKYNKMQLNCHPFSWTEWGYDNTNNLLDLLIEKRKENIISIMDEYKTFPPEIQ